jgi:primosomal replication protein N''
MHNTRHEIAISRLSTLLDHLSVQAKQKDQLNSKHESHRLIENNNLFSLHLFTTESDQLSLYVDEVRKRLNEFSRLYHLGDKNTNKAEFALSSLQRIEQQISALMNAIQANQSMHKAAQVSYDVKKKVRVKIAQNKQKNHYDKIAKSVLLSSHQLHQQLNEHHEFERRLVDMITEREQQRIRSKSINTDKISQEVLALHQRLGRCRKAISDIERNISLSEKNNLR